MEGKIHVAEHLASNMQALPDSLRLELRKARANALREGL